MAEQATEQEQSGGASYKENYCDIVMKGGVTSGIVYPQAIAELAQHYRLKNIGGTSAGAIAACLAAAAEYRRSETGSLEGYEKIKALATELSSHPENAPKNEKIKALATELSGHPENVPKKKFSRLFGLFQPSEKTAPLFKILRSTLNRENGKKRSFGALKGAISAYWGMATIVFLAGMAIAGLFLAFVQSLSSCLALGSWVISVPLALAFVLFVIAYPMIGVPAKDWKSELALSVAVLVLTAYFAPPVMCAVALMPAVAFGALLAGVYIAWRIYRLLLDMANDEKQGFGLCTGMPPDKNANIAKEYEGYEALTPWLDRKIREISGKPEADGPLTFGDLWRAEGFPPKWLEEDFRGVDETQKKSINLQLITTNLTHGRPYILPFDDELARIFFRIDELKPFFPENILKSLLEKSKEYEPPNGYPQGKKAIRQLPAAEDLPVLFAARLSLSFPGLLSAIPLYAIDEEPKKSKRKLERCWFSDGGISSNFPIHFFDGFLPIWPTFGFTLEETLKHSPNRKVGMPSTYEEGKEEAWNRFHDKKDLERLTGFFGAISNAARNWNDNTLTRMPGVRERVVHIYLDSKKEGGLNLNMPKKTIKKLVGRGKRAANEIVTRYVNKSFPGKGVTMDFDNHAWVRLNTFVDMFSAHIPALKRALDKKRTGVSYYVLIRDAAARNKGQYPLTDTKDIERLEEFINVLSDLPNKFKDGTIVQDKVRPAPKGALRGRPLL